MRKASSQKEKQVRGSLATAQLDSALRSPLSEAAKPPQNRHLTHSHRISNNGKDHKPLDQLPFRTKIDFFGGERGAGSLDSTSPGPSVPPGAGARGTKGLSEGQ